MVACRVQPACFVSICDKWPLIIDDVFLAQVLIEKEKPRRK